MMDTPFDINAAINVSIKVRSRYKVKFLTMILAVALILRCDHTYQILLEQHMFLSFAKVCKNTEAAI